MPVQVINISKYLILFTVSLSLASCTVAYNSIQYTKSDSPILSTLEKKIRKRKYKDNAIIIHFEGDLLQINNLEFKTDSNFHEFISGDIIMLDHHLDYSYNIMKHNKRDRMNELEVAGPKCAYFKQTHIFADTALISEAKIQIQEKNIENLTMYYRSRVLLYILIVVGTGGFLILWFLIKALIESLSFA